MNNHRGSKVHAAAGGVGLFAVQFARWKGAHVIGTASVSKRVETGHSRGRVILRIAD